jgi:hypothetical protein
MGRSWCLGVALVAISCGGESDPMAAMHGETRGSVPNGTPLDAPTAPPLPRDHSRVVNRGGPVLASMRLQVLGVASLDPETQEDVRGVLAWVFGSGYWAILSEYGVSGDVAVAYDDATNDGLQVRTGSKARNELVTWRDIEGRILRARARRPESERGQPILYFLPDGVTVRVAERTSYVYRTCVDVWGYHRHDGVGPYAVLGACPMGRSAFILTHELAEMATDPEVGSGWSLGVPSGTHAGEVADLYKSHGPAWVDGWAVARLWSNRLGSCFPN